MTKKKLVLDKELTRPLYGDGAQTGADVMRAFDKAADWCKAEQEKAAKAVEKATP